MFGSRVLDAAIGLILVYLLLGLICTSLQELLEWVLRKRAADLHRGIKLMLDGDATLTAQFYNHPLIFALYDGDYSEGRGRLPSYIPSDVFAVSLLDSVKRAAGVAGTMSPDALQTTLDSLQRTNPRLAMALETLLQQAAGDFTRLQNNVESWFNSSMDRVSGWYKRRAQLFVLIIAAFTTLVLNVDSLRVAGTLWSNQALRDALVLEAEAIANDSTRRAPDLQARYSDLRGLGIPIGWTNVQFAIEPGKPSWWRDYVAQPVIGWLLTILAASLGAPFWFDMLNKVMVIRSTVKPREKSQEEGSEDRSGGRKEAPRLTRQTIEKAGTGTAALRAAKRRTPSGAAAGSGLTATQFGGDDDEVGVI